MVLSCTLCVLVLLFCFPASWSYPYNDEDDTYNPYNNTGPYLDHEYYSSYSTHQPYSDESAAWSSSPQQHDPESCPHGECPSSLGPEDEQLYDETDPRYPYDNCFYEEDGNFAVNGTELCDLLVEGGDQYADLLTGGIDGVYTLDGCFEGKPVYSRWDSPPKEERCLFYNPYFSDWQFSIGQEPNEDQLVMYGDLGKVSPLDVPRWHLAAALNTEQSGLLPSEDEDLYFVADGITVRCVSDESQAVGVEDERY